MKKCYMCNKSINDNNKSREHIILNALGGRLKSFNLLCKCCNSRFGDKIDFELAKQFEYITNILNIKRDDGEIPKSVRATGIDSGDDYIVSAGGKPKHLKPDIVEKPEEGIIRIIANDHEQAKKIILGMKRKYPEINVEHELEKLKTKKLTKTLPEKMGMNMTFGGDDAFRSLCKSAINYYMLNNGNRDMISHLFPFIKRECENEFVSLYYTDDEVIDKTDSEILHSIIVIGDKAKKVLYSYIELFSFYKTIILLNDEYEGESFEKSYIYDLLNNKEVTKKITIKINQNEIKNIVKNRTIPLEKITRTMEKVIAIALKKIRNESMHRMIENAINNSFLKYPEGVPMSQEMFNDFWDELKEDLTLWISENTKNSD